MKLLLWESITDPLRITCNLLAFLIPYVVYKLNRRLHKYGDPTWKQEEMKQSEEENE